jgi:hypothetical protein
MHGVTAAASAIAAATSDSTCTVAASIGHRGHETPLGRQRRQALPWRFDHVLTHLFALEAEPSSNQNHPGECDDTDD